MNRIDELFLKKRSNILTIYCTAGYPKFNSTIEVLTTLQKNDVDLAEIGIPCSDPVADGLVIQNSNAIAIKNGMTVRNLFVQLKNMRKIISLPVILMGYFNSVLQFGVKNFCKAAAKVGIDGIILPDLPAYEFETQYQQIFKKHNLKCMFLVTPQTSEERIKKIDSLSTGFIYAVSSLSVTGFMQSDKNIKKQESYFRKLKNMQLKNPVLAGFGIKDRKTFAAACKHANGAIIGSAYVNALKDSTDIFQSTKEFLNTRIR